MCFHRIFKLHENSNFWYLLRFLHRYPRILEIKFIEIYGSKFSENLGAQKFDAKLSSKWLLNSAKWHVTSKIHNETNFFSFLNHWKLFFARICAANQGIFDFEKDLTWQKKFSWVYLFVTFWISKTLKCIT